MATLVRFLIEKNTENEVFAYFPQLSYYKENYLNIKTCYSHFGQHSSCAVEYAKKCKQANVKQYLPLKTELESIGYNLKVLKK